jgi:hypothetical protein
VSRFADTGATTRVVLGACECPGTPHDEDWATVRAQLSATEIGQWAMADAETVAEVACQFVTGWNLLGPDGKPWPPTAQSIVALMPPTLTLLVKALSDAVQASSKPLPNASAAPSRGSSRGSGSPTRTTRPRS